MGKFTLSFNNVCAIDNIEINHDSVKTPSKLLNNSKTSRPVDDSYSDAINNAEGNENNTTWQRKNEEGKQKQLCVNLESGSTSSPDIITIKINLKKNGNSLIEKNVTGSLRKKLRLLFEEEDTERNLAEGVAGEIKERKKRRVENGLNDQVTEDEIIGEELEDKIKNRKKKKVIHMSDNDEKNDLKDGDHDINIENSKEVIYRVGEKEDAGCLESDVNIIEDQNVGNDLVKTNNVDEKCQINPAVSEVIGSITSSVSSGNSNQRSKRGVPRIVKRIAPAKHTKYECPECGMLKVYMPRHVQICHSQVSKEEMIRSIGVTARQLWNAQQQTNMCPICHLSFTNLKVHKKHTHTNSVNDLYLEKQSLVASNAKRSACENTTTVTPELREMPIVKEFMEYMLDEQKGAVEEATAKSYAAHVKNFIVFYLPPDGEFTNDVCAHFGNLDDKNGFFEHAMKTMTPVMMCQCIAALHRFLAFIEQEKKYCWFNDLNHVNFYRLKVLRLWGMSAIMMHQSKV